MAPTFDTLRLEVSGAVGELVLDRPERLNALGATTLRELAAAAQWFDDHDAVRVVVVRGEGRAFCAGADLHDMPLAGARSDAPWHVRREIGQLGLRMTDAIEGMRAVTVAQVHGHAVGGGLLVMLACDLRVVADDASFHIPEVDLGIPLAWGGIPRLVREVGPAVTKELVMTCRRFTPDEAHRLGMVNRVVSPDRLDAEVDALAAELADKPSVPVIVTKEHVNAVSQAMAAGRTSFADGDALLSAAFDPASTDAAQRYVERVFGSDAAGTDDDSADGGRSG